MPVTERPPRLAGFAVFAAMLSAAGLPIYIHAPAYYAASYGVGLAALGTILFALRLLDVVQDPVLGWLAARVPRGPAVALGTGLLALSMVGLFAVTPPVAPALWFALMLTGLFSAFSFLTISFYAQGVSTAAGLGRQGHLRLAGWRETGALLGVAVAAVAPTLLAGTGDEYAAFAVGFAGFCLLGAWLMRGEWTGHGDRVPAANGFGPVLRDPLARRLLFIAFVNAAPVAVSSTLFLFFVDSVLAAPLWSGPLLLLFFLAAAASAPVWSRVATRIGSRAALTTAMVAAIAAFATVPLLGPGDTIPFAIICLLSGATLGADLTLLPALFARRLGQVAPGAAEGFGLWSFMSKLTLAFAAIAVLPALEAAGYVAGGDNSTEALRLLSWLYAGVPCVLKLLALAFLWAGRVELDENSPRPMTESS